MWSTYLNLISLLGALFLVRLIAALRRKPLGGFPRVELVFIVQPAIEGTTQCAGILMRELFSCKSAGIFSSMSMLGTFAGALITFVLFPGAFICALFWFLRHNVRSTATITYVEYVPKKSFGALAIVKKIVSEAKKALKERRKKAARHGGTVQGRSLISWKRFVNPHFIRRPGRVGPQSRVNAAQQSSDPSAAPTPRGLYRQNAQRLSLRRKPTAREWRQALLQRLAPTPAVGMWMDDPLFAMMYGRLYQKYNAENGWFYAWEAAVCIIQSLIVSMVQGDNDAKLRGGFSENVISMAQPIIVMTIRIIHLTMLLLRRPFVKKKQTNQQILCLLQHIYSTVLLITGGIFPSLLPSMCIGAIFSQALVPFVLTIVQAFPALPALPNLPLPDSIDFDHTEWLRCLLFPATTLMSNGLFWVLRRLENLYPAVERLDEGIGSAAAAVRRLCRCCCCCCAPRDTSADDGGSAADGKPIGRSAAGDKKPQQLDAGQNLMEVEMLPKDDWAEGCVHSADTWFRGHVWPSAHARGMREVFWIGRSSVRRASRRAR